MELNDISGKIIGCAIKVHKVLGPGLLESSYEKYLIYEMRKTGLNLRSQVTLPILYEGVRLDAGYKLDLLVEEKVIVELKSVEKLLANHEAQLLTYLSLANKRLGLLINFNVSMLKDGIKRKIN